MEKKNNAGQSHPKKESLDRLGKKLYHIINLLFAG